MLIVIPKLTAYRTLVGFKSNLPIKTGNLVYNATGLGYVQPFEYTVEIDESEADYTKDVYNHYLKKGIDFIDHGVEAMVDILSFDLNDGLPIQNQVYNNQLRKLLGNAKSTPAREFRNLLRGSGNYASKNAVKAVDGAKYLRRNVLKSTLLEVDQDKLAGNMLRAISKFGGAKPERYFRTLPDKSKKFK